MIEIDGEFFEDPCELKRKEKVLAIVNCLIDTASNCVKAEMNGVPDILIYALKDVGKVQAAMIQAQPLWPPSGGMVIGVDPAAPGKDRCFQGGVEI